MARPVIERGAEFAWTTDAERFAVQKVWADEDETVQVTVVKEDDETVSVTLDDLYGYLDDGQIAEPPEYEQGETIMGNSKGVRILHVKGMRSGVWIYEVEVINLDSFTNEDTCMATYDEPSIKRLETSGTESQTGP